MKPAALRAENERLKDFIAGCVKLGGQQTEELRQLRAKLLAIAGEVNAVFNADADPKKAIERIGDALGSPF